MFWKRKKEETQVREIHFPCNHKYKDFPWYLKTSWHNANYDYKIDMITNSHGKINIIAPYVCIHCKEQKDVVLLSEKVDSQKVFHERIKEIQEKYKDKLCDKVIVMNQINDFQLIDREYLEAARKLFPDRGI